MKKTYLLLLLIVFNHTVNSQKQFELYDAMAFPGKPELSSEGLLPVFLMYEAVLTKKDPATDRLLLDMDKINIQAELAANFPHVMVSTDIEGWFGDSSVDQNEMFSRFTTMFNVFRAKNPNVVIGNYGIAPSALCVYRYYDGGQTDNATLIEKWKTNNQKRWKSIEAADVITPVIYIAEPNIISWIQDLETTVAEIKNHNSDKKIIAYIWPQYYDKPGSPYNREVITPEIWKQMLEAVYEKCDGAIIWSGTTDKDGNPVRWNSKEIQALWNETKDFIHRHKANMAQPTPGPELIINDNPDKTFKLFASLNYSGTPGLESSGIHSIRLVSEKDISYVLGDDGIYKPDLEKVESMGQSLSAGNSYPVCITGGSWIRDRMSNPGDMISRYSLVSRVFKDNNNNNNPLGFFQIAPTSLSGLRTSNANSYVNISNWMHSATIPTRPLTEYADYLIPASYIVDDDTTLWKKEFYLAVKEAKLNSHGKPVYAYFYTDYFNVADNFVDGYKPIKEKTFLAMLEAAFKMCDGVIMTNVGSEIWNEDLGFWKATKQFIEKYKDNVDFPEMWSVEGNILQNGSFDEPIVPSADETTFSVTRPAPLNSQGFFDALSRTTSPTTVATAIPDYVWFERGTTQHQCRLYPMENKSCSGSKSMAIHNVGANTNNATSTTNGWMYHNLAQRISLDDTNVYELTFYVQRDHMYRNVENDINDLYVGIVSSTDAVPQTNFTYYEKVQIAEDESWKKISVTFDLPKIIDASPGKSFETCAVFIAMQTGWNSETNTTKQSLVYVDDVSLVAHVNSSVRPTQAGNKLLQEYLSFNNKIMTLKKETNSLKVYDTMGRILLNESSLKQGYTFNLKTSGIYLISINQKIFKLLVK